jgi:ABC-type multidrug transport system ATPase subunit
MTLLEARALRVVLGGAVIVEDLTLTTRGDRVLLVGGARGIMATLSGVPHGSTSEQARVAGGSLTVLGCDVASGAHRTVAGFAPLDPPIWPRFTVMEYLAWHARLCGYAKRAARARALAVLQLLKLEEGRRRRLAGLPLVARRALAIAAALVNEPKALVIDNPFEELDTQAQDYMQELIARASAGRATLLAFPELAAAPASLLQSATDVCVLRDGRLVTQGEPAALFGGARLFEVAIARGADALRAELSHDGLTLEGGPVHFVLRIPEGRTATDVLAAASRARAAVVRCMPVF